MTVRCSSVALLAAERVREVVCGEVDGEEEGEDANGNTFVFILLVLAGLLPEVEVLPPLFTFTSAGVCDCGEEGFEEADAAIFTFTPVGGATER